MVAARKMLRACALVLAVQLCLTACERGAGSGPALDLAIARQSYSGGYFLEAETAYERYLQSDPQGGSRLEAWTRLVDICAGVKGDPDKAVNLLLEEKGRHFDPALVDAFVASLPAICAIKEQFAESQAGSPAPA